MEQKEYSAHPLSGFTQDLGLTYLLLLAKIYTKTASLFELAAFLLISRFHLLHGIIEPAVHRHIQPEFLCAADDCARE